MHTEHEILPLGTIVLLINGSKRLMIYGRYQQHPDTGTSFDYAGCLYPEGNIDSKHIFLFNHSDIETVVFEGYSDSENEQFLKNVKAALQMPKT